MPKIFVKNLPRLTLNDLLRRRRMTLKRLLDDFGITTYPGLVSHCNRIGVAPPAEADFKAIVKVVVNNPLEGVVVLEPPNVIDEHTGKIIDPDGPVHADIVIITDPAPEPTEGTQKRPRRKKDTTTDE